MRGNSFSQVLGQYLWQYRLVAAMFLLFSVIFAGIFALYGLETEAVLYGAGLCGLVAMVVLSIHFWGYYRKHRALRRIGENVLLLGDELPSPAHLLEDDYRRMVVDLIQRNLDNQTRWQAERSDGVDFYTTWVHQIKAPIAVMALILQGEDTDAYKALLSELFRIEQYTDMVLCYFRLDSASSDFVLQPCPLDDIIRQAIHKYAPQFVRKRIGLTYAGTTAQVLTDEKWLLFVLEQLLSNAIKYTDRGGITVAVDERQVLTITDTGIGIAAEDLPRIFQKGFTGYNGHAHRKATGLGLYLCKRATDKLSHGLAVTSRVGVGTVVTLDLHTAPLEVE